MTEKIPKILPDDIRKAVEEILRQQKARDEI